MCSLYLAGLSRGLSRVHAQRSHEQGPRHVRGGEPVRAGVAQADVVPEWGSGGRGFASRRPDGKHKGSDRLRAVGAFVALLLKRHAKGSAGAPTIME